MLCTWQDATTKVMNGCIHYSSLCSGKLETDTNHTVIHIKPTLWPLPMEGVGHAGKYRDLNSHIENAGNIDMGPKNDNESTNSVDTMIAFRGTEADGHLSVLLPNSQADVNILAREINSLWQCAGAGEDQTAKGLDCIDHLEWELQNLSLALRAQLTSTPASMEQFREVVHQYTDTLCTTQKH